MDFFLKIKTWQLFILFIGVPYVLLHLAPPLGPLDRNNILKLTVSFSLFFMIVFLFWLWSIGVGINKRIIDKLRPKSKFFKFGIIYCAVYMIIFHILFLVLSKDGIPPVSLLPLFPMHIFATYCIYYALYFVAKNLFTFENNEAVKFSTFSGTFFLLCLLPIGIWFIQYRINRIYETPRT